MKVSIAMATYNGAKYLQEQLDSFVDQSRQPDELIVADDCSSDITVKIVEQFAKNAPFKVTFHENDHNYGYCGNFNQALLKTTGDLVFLSDQDDVWFPEKIERMSAMAAEDYQSLVFMNDAALTDFLLKDSGLTKLGQIKSAGFDQSSFVMGCCAAVKRELLDFCLPIPEAYPAHDNWIVGIAEGMGRKRIHSEVLQYYRRHGQNESDFIANRTKRVTRTQVFIHSIKSLYKQYLNRIDGVTACSTFNNLPLELMSDWVKDAIGRVQEPYASDLFQYSLLLDQQIKLQYRRNEVRMQKFPARLTAASKLLLKGDYSDASGWKSAFRDLMG